MRLLMELQALAAEEEEEGGEEGGSGAGDIGAEDGKVLQQGGGRFAALEAAWAEKPRPAPSLGDVRSETVGCLP